ncbi:MAG: sialidase family protein [bacterium]
MKKVLFFGISLIIFGVASVALATMTTFGIDQVVSALPGWQFIQHDSLAVGPDKSVYVVYDNEEIEPLKFLFAKQTAGVGPFTSYVLDPAGDGAKNEAIDINKQGTLVASWVRGNNFETQVHFAYSTNGGDSFSNPAAVSTVGYNMFPEADMGKSGSAYIVWKNFDTYLNGKLYFSKTNNGQTFSTPKVIDGDMAGNIVERYQGTTVHMDVLEGTDTRNDIIGVCWQGFLDDYNTEYAWAAVSTDGGQTFTQPIMADPAQITSFQYSPGCTVDENYLYLSFDFDGDIYFTRMKHGNTSFEPIRIVSTEEAVAQTVTIDSARPAYIYMAWDDNRNTSGFASEGYFMRSFDGGETWTDETNFEDDNPGYSPDVSYSFVQMANDKSAHVSFSNDLFAGTGRDIFYDTATVPFQAFATANTPVVHRNEYATFKLTVKNYEEITKQFDYWLEAYLPNGSSYGGNPISPSSTTIGPNGSLSANKSVLVPGTAPFGTYRMCFKVGTYPDAEDGECAYFDVVQ